MKRRDFPIITLAPWEHAPNARPEEIEARAQNVVPFQWRDQNLLVAARYAQCCEGERYLFVCFVDEEDEGNWVLGYAQPEARNLPRRYLRRSRLKLAKQLSYLTYSRVFPFRRVFYFEPEALGVSRPALAFIATDGSGGWTSLAPGDEENSHIPFSLDDAMHDFRLPLQEQEDSLRHVPPPLIRERLLKELEYLGSEAYFALHWREKSHVERENLLLEVDQGSVDEFRHLLTCALRFEAVLQQQVGQWAWFIDGERSGLTFWNSASGFPAWVALPFRLKVWERAAFDYFKPSGCDSLLKRHKCARQWFQNRPSFVGLTTESPSQHERLEAALFLRDWARDKIPPRKLLLLLSRV